MARLFGTDGVRGIANTELTPELAFYLGYCGALVLAHRHLKHTESGRRDEGVGSADLAPSEPIRPKVVVGMDTRLSGPILSQALCAGLCAAGADAYACGVIPTPGIAFLTRDLDFDAGVVISASHNPYEFNGIKFFNRKGYKLSDAQEDEIETLMRALGVLPGQTEADQQQARQNLPETLLHQALNRPTGSGLGRISVYQQGVEHYLHHLRYAMGLDLTGLKIALDCANGAAFDLAPRLFRQLGADLVIRGQTPDGININQDCGSTHLQGLSELVVAHQCDIGLAFDGDADRLLAVDETGQPADGDVILAILAQYLKNKGRLAKNRFVVTVMSNFGLTRFAEDNGFEWVTTQVGDRYVLEALLEQGLNLGGEQSGHLILTDYSTTGDGLLSALALLKALRRSHQSLKQARQMITLYPQVLLPARVKNEHKGRILNHPTLQAEQARIEAALKGRGRVLVRASGTEPLIRVMLEGEDLTWIQTAAQSLVTCVLNLDQADEI